MMTRSASPISKLTGRLFAVALMLVSAVSWGQDKYQNAREAMNVGFAFLNARNYKSAQDPLEQALTLALDDATRLRVSDGLMLVYRQLALAPKMIERSEFIIEKSDQEAKRSITRRSLIEFVRQQNLGDEFIRRHEEQLAKDPNHRTSLYVLAEAYDQIRRDPQKAGEIAERLLKLEQAAGKPQNVLALANLAGQHAKARKYKEAAELYEQIAPLDAKLAAWHWKEAAAAWLSQNDKERALAAARKSAAAAPESRSELLEYFWRKGLADVFLKAGDPAAAIKNYEAALEKTKIEGYRKDCERLLQEAKQQAATRATSRVS